MSIDISQVMSRKDFGTSVALGEVQRATGVNRFAFMPTIGSDYETVWEDGDIYAYPSSSVPMTVTSSAGATDETVEITITGLDSDWRQKSETVILNASGTATSGNFLRINEARISNGVEATGAITISNGGTTYAKITPEFGKTLSSVYTVPAGYAAYVLSGDLSIAKQKEVITKLMIRQEGGIFVAEGIIGTSGSPFHKEWIVPIALPAKTDVEIRAKAGATTEIAISLDMLLVELD